LVTGDVDFESGEFNEQAASDVGNAGTGFVGVMIGVVVEDVDRARDREVAVDDDEIDSVSD
jgi:hypothetical protein